MTIEARIRLKDGAVITRLFDNFSDVDELLDRHREHVEQIETRTVTVRQMRQGRNYDG